MSVCSPVSVHYILGVFPLNWEVNCRRYFEMSLGNKMHTSSTLPDAGLSKHVSNRNNIIKSDERVMANKANPDQTDSFLLVDFT